MEEIVIKEIEKNSYCCTVACEECSLTYGCSKSGPGNQKKEREDAY